MLLTNFPKVGDYVRRLVGNCVCGPVMRIIGFVENGTKALCQRVQGYGYEIVLVALLVAVPLETMKCFFEGHPIDDLPHQHLNTIVSSGTTTTTPAPI